MFYKANFSNDFYFFEINKEHVDEKRKIYFVRQVSRCVCVSTLTFTARFRGLNNASAFHRALQRHSRIVRI